MGRPIPEDDSVQQDVTADDAVVDAAAEKKDVEDAVVEDAPQEEEYTVEQLEAALKADDKSGWVPQGRFNEVNEKARRAETAAEALQQALLHINAAKAPVVEATAVRDFAAELKDLKLKYKEGDMVLDDYLDARDAIVMDRTESKTMERIAPTVRNLETQANQMHQEKVNDAYGKAFAKVVDQYPFLDVNSDDRNNEALNEIVAYRNKLVSLGLDSIEALETAVSKLAPKYVTEDEVAYNPDVGNIATQRKVAAQRALADIGKRVPANVGKAGTSNRSNNGKVVLNRSVADHEKWLKIPEAEREKVVTPYG